MAASKRIRDEVLRAGDVSSGEQPLYYDLTEDVDLVADSPGGEAYCRDILIIKEGTLVGTDSYDNAFSYPSLPVGLHLPYYFATLDSTSTAEVICCW